MTGWLVMRVLCCFYFTGTLTTLALGFAAVYSEDARPARHIQPGRRFGGYRIVPKSCKDLTSQGKAKGICMFNYECVQMGGSVVGSCMDGFLYGACCKLPPGVVYSGIEIPSTTPTTTSSKPIPPQVKTVKPLTSHPVGDTILFHKNGSVVQDVNSPEEFDLLKNPSTGGHANTPFPELSTFSYISGPGGIVSASGSFPVKQPEEDENTWPSKTPQYSPTETAPFTSSMQITTRKENESLPSTTTKYSSFTKPFSNKVTYPSNSYPYVTKPSDSYTYNHIISGSPYKDTTPYYNLVTKPGYLTSNNIPHKVKPTTPLPLTSAIDKYHTGHYHLHEEDNMVLVQTIDVNKPDVEDATNVASINHILSILNETGPSPELIPTSPSLSTWVSINGKPDKTSAVPVYSSSNYYYTTKQPTSSGATMQHVVGPSFQVTPQVNITPKPQASTTPEPAPTVIVLGPLNPQSTKKPTRKPIQTYTTPSYNLKPTHTVTVLSSPEHSTVVTLKPDTNVISVNPPHLSYVTHRPTWTTVTPLYHSESHVSVSHSTYTTKPPYTATKPVHHNKPQSSQDHSTSKPTIYSTVNKPAVYTTAKPTVYTTAKPAVYTTAKPAVYSSSKPGVSASHKPIVYTTAYPASQTKPMYQSTLSNTKPVHTTYVSNRPVSSSRPVYSTTKPTFVIPTQQDVSNATEDLVAFPPVRDPNITLIVPQHEKPGIDQLTSVTTLDDETQSTPQFVVDENLDNKVHGFVEKIVQSLEGNFVDLENVLLDGQRRPNTTLTQKPVKKPTTPTTSSTTTRRPTKKPVKKPASSSTDRPTVSKPSAINKPSSSIIVSTYRPKPQESTTTITIKPSKKPSAPPTLILFQPSTTILTTTVSPTPSTTKRPKPIKRPPSTIESINVVEEVTEVTSQTTTTPKPTTEVNYKKECGVRPLMKNGRIVGGKGATFGEWPWQVLVREATWLGLFTKNKCGGVLITSRYVITAAHCQPGFLASLVAVFGEYDISGEVESKRSVSKNVRRVIVHRQYDAATFENDIALLELDSPVQFDTHIVPICMPKDDDDFTGRMATVTGWGRLKYGGGVPSVLQEVQVPVMENNVCQEMFHTAGHSKSIISSFLCAGYANGQRDSCEGDSGGPLMVEREDGRWVLAGTVSHGIKCAAPYLPGVYMRTTYYKPWLQTITGVRSL